MKAEIIVIGDELLIGQVTDTNSGMIARQLNALGIEVSRTTAIHDDAAEIIHALDEAFSRVELVLTTGGLGPTKDDITKTTLCRYFGTRLVASAAVEKHVRELYKDRPDVLNRLTETQWQVPEACSVLENRVGSAPIMEFETQSDPVQGTQKHVLYSMPGVPYEAKIAMREQILPRLQKRFQTGTVLHRTLVVYGIPESSLAIQIEEWENSLPQNMHLAYLPKHRMIRLRLTGISAVANDGELEQAMTEQIELLKPQIAPYLIAEEDIPIERIVGERLRQQGRTVASAESCTGGKIAVLLNKHAGSSAFYKGSVVAYDNSVKQEVLGVSTETLAAKGAVSEDTVRQMAEGVRRLLKTDYAVATSGIAGPDGGTAEKPVGTVWMAVATAKETIAECRFFRGDREQITDQAAFAALLMLNKAIK